MPALVNDRLLQKAPWLLNGISERTRRQLFLIFETSPREWAPVCEGLPKPSTVAHLLKWRPSCLLTFPGFGRLTLGNVVQVLAKHGLELSPQRSITEYGPS